MPSPFTSYLLGNEQSLVDYFAVGHELAVVDAIGQGPPIQRHLVHVVAFYRPVIERGYERAHLVKHFHLRAARLRSPEGDRRLVGSGVGIGVELLVGAQREGATGGIG
jgi:hypothetical protein